MRTGGVHPLGLASSLAAPVLLIGGWTLAAARQEGGFDQVAGTISALAATGADDRWVMTAALAGLGACHVVTAAALRDAATPGRVVLAVGGVATAAVAALPLPAGDGESAAHTVAAGLAFGALAVWPLVAGRPGARGPLRRTPSAVAGTALLGLVGWFAAELVTGTDRVGLAERVAAGAQALWPLAAAWGTHLARRSR